jgi:PKD repeat protein
MRKIMRLILLLLTPTLLLVFIKVVLAGPVDSHATAKGKMEQVGQNFLVAPAPFRPVILSRTPLAQSSIYITHTPAYVHLPVRFTAVVSPAGVDSYLWDFGDGTSASSGNSTSISHTYDVTGDYVVGVTSFFHGQTTELVTVGVSPNQVHLPLVFQNFSPPDPDLVCQALRFEPTNPSTEDTILLTVEMENQGGQPADGFWVDLYINPTEPVTGNQRWGTICGPPADCLGGIAWAISEERNSGPIFGGETRELLSIPSNFVGPEQGFDPIHSEWDGTLPAGDHKLFAYVDSWHPSNSYGAVLESDENNNRCGPVSITVTPASSFKTNFSQPGSLPKRPKP